MKADGMNERNVCVTDADSRNADIRSSCSADAADESAASVIRREAMLLGCIPGINPVSVPEITPASDDAMSSRSVSPLSIYPNAKIWHPDIGF